MSADTPRRPIGGPAKAGPKPLRRRVRLGTSDRLEDYLWRRREVLSEGEVCAAKDGRHIYQGSTMISIDLSPVLVTLRSVDRSSFMRLLTVSPLLRLRAMRLSLAEAERRASACPKVIGLGSAELHIDARVDENLLLLDVDFEAPVQHAQVPSAAPTACAPRLAPNTVMNVNEGDNNEEKKVIHVDFGHPRAGQRRDKGSVAQGEPTTRSERAHQAEAMLASPPRPNADPVSGLYSFRDVARLFGIKETKLRYWNKTGIIEPSATHGQSRMFTFQDLVGVRTAKELTDQGVPVQKVRKSIESLRLAMPRLCRPLTEMRVIADGKGLVVRDQSGPFEPTTGQRLLDFRVDQLREQVVEELHPKGISGLDSPKRAEAYEYYLEGCRLDEEEATWRQAESAYLRAIELDPTLSNALTNLGNLRYRQRREREAEDLYREALRVQPGQPEALYNLGFLSFEHGKLENAVAAFEQAIESDPSFADAHFNLAMVYEELSQKDSARAHWDAYLELEPKGPWADVARRHRG